MRIISGSFKGRELKFPKHIRPTSQKVRKAIFDILGSSVRDSAILELFAGSGAVGLEAFSYGAREVTFVDNNLNCLKLIEANLKSLDITSYHIRRSDSFLALDFFVKKGLVFDFVFLDPPYLRDLTKNSLIRLGACDILKPLGLLIIEHHKKEKLPEREGGLMLFKRKNYGETVLSFYSVMR